MEKTNVYLDAWGRVTKFPVTPYLVKERGLKDKRNRFVHKKSEEILQIDGQQIKFIFCGGLSDSASMMR